MPAAISGFFHLSRISDNAKTGPIAVTSSPRMNCPPTCPLLKKCYGEYGPVRLHWNLIDAGKRGTDWQTYLEQLKALPKWILVRLWQIGDFPGKNGRLNLRALREIVQAVRNKKAFTFTHYLLKTKAEREAVRDANANGLTINLSANGIRHADKLKQLGIAPVVTIVEDYATMPTHTPAGHRLVKCPQQTHKITCDQCQLCAVADRKSIVAFEAHGPGAKYARALAHANS